MNRTGFGLGLVALLAGLAIFGSGIAAANGNGAVVERDPYGTPWSCFVTDTSGNLWPFQCTIHRVTTPQGQINEFLQGPVTGGRAL